MIAHTMNSFKQISQLARFSKREQPRCHKLIRFVPVSTA